MPKCHKIIFLLIFISPFLLKGQGQLFVHNFLPSDYPGKTQNWVVKIDDNNIVWVGNQQGLMKFNGNQWEVINTSQKSTVRSMSFSKNGSLFAGAIGDFGVIENDSTGASNFKSLTSKIPPEIAFTDVWSTVATGDTTLFLTDNYLFAYYADSITFLSNQYKYFYLAFEIDQNCIIQQIGGGLFKYKADSLLKIENSNIFARQKVHAIIKYNEQKHIIATKYNGLYFAEFNNNFTKIEKIKPFKTEVDEEIKTNTVYQTKPICNNLIGIATTNGGLYVIDLNGKLKHRFNIDNQLLTDAVYDFSCTKNGAIWLAQDMGLSIVEIGLPIEYYNYKSGVKGTVSDISMLNQVIYVTTGFGAFWMDKKAGFNEKKFYKIDSINTQAWDILVKERESENPEIYIAAADGIYKVEKNKSGKVYANSDVYTLYAYTKNKNLLFAGTRSGLLLLEKKSNQWEILHRFGGIVHQVRDIIEDDKGNVWIAANYKGFYQITETDINNLVKQKIAPVLTPKDTAHGLKTLRNLQFHPTKEELFYVALPDIYSYDDKTDQFTHIKIDSANTSNSNRKFNIRDYFTIRDKVIFFGDKSEKSVDSTTLQRLPYDITVAAWTDSAELWIGAENGLYNYHIDEKSTHFENFSVYFNKYKTGSNNWQYVSTQEQKIFKEIDFKNNSITVEVSIPFYYNHQQSEISFFLDGFDNKYEAWHHQFKKSYTNLPAGEYTLYARAKNTFGFLTERALMKIKIHPPIYQTTWAYVIYILVWLIVMFVAIRYRTQQLRKSKEKLEDTVQERTQQLLDRNEEVMQVADILKENNKKLQELSIVAEKAGNAVAIFNKDGKLDYCNEAFEDLYGYTCEDFRTERGSFLFENSEYPHIRKAYERCIKDKTSVQYEYFTLSKKHEGLWIHTTLTPVFTNDGTLEQFIAIDTNITQLKNAEEEVRFQKEELERKSKELAEKNQELQRLSIIARETDNAVILTDKRGSLLWVNEGFTRLYGFTLKELRQEKGNIFTMSSNKRIGKVISEWPENQSSITYESQNPTKDGRKIWAQTTLTPIRDENEKINQIIAIDSDITALKNAEEQIENQRDQLKTLNATKDKFFSIIGHDLRSPFGNFVNMTNIIMQNITTSDTQTLLNYVSKLQRSAQNSYNLLENLLDWARHQQGRIKYYPDFDDITAIAEEMVELLLPLAEKKKIKVSIIYEEPVYAYFDEPMIKTVVRNLLFNALKFTPSGGEIKIYFQRDQNKVKLFVQDSGIGITPEAQKKIFRTDTHFSTLGTDKERGTGLGLMLSKDFVEMNGGTIEVESEPGKGSTFIITLPARVDET